MSTLKPYRTVSIEECGEPLLTVPKGVVAFYDPHPYLALGAPYGSTNPWMLRETIVESLLSAQNALSAQRPGWKIKLFDAYRPNAVQHFMVNHELHLVAQAEGLNVATLTDAQRDALMVKVFRVWAIPSDDPKTPPPHSTGAVFDCTLIDEAGAEIDMGSPIDENSDRSSPDYFANASDEDGRKAHAHRNFLNALLEAQGFRRNPNEWWHFSRGDQLAIWAARNQKDAPRIAIYGRADLIGSV